VTIGPLDLLVLAGMTVGFLLIPLGLPGLWIMLASLAGAALARNFDVRLLLFLVVLAALAELIEFLLVQRMNLRYGGSPRAFWGALAGGLVGVVVGLPVPVIGSVLGGLAGTFLGALLVTLHETRALGGSARVGWGVLLGRLWATAAKLVAGGVIFLAGAAYLVLR
jgi:uncharacterized protein